jgi:HK97 gp10 family phage protein
MANSVHKFAFRGAEDLFKVLEGIPADVRSEILERACVKAAEPIRAATSRAAPKRSGALKASIAIKGISNKQKGTAAALIGPDRNYYRGGKRVKANGDRRGADRPANYAHLVEFGHLSGTSSEKFGGFEKGSALKPSKTGARTKQATARSFVLPRPFMRPGFTAGAPAAESIMAREIGASIERSRARRVKAGTHKG